MSDAVIVSTAHIPIGQACRGVLSDIHAPALSPAWPFEVP